MGRNTAKKDAKLERVRALFLDAASSGDLAALRDLSDKVDADLAIRDGSDALMLAARSGHVGAVEFLMSACDPKSISLPQIYSRWGPDGHGFDALMQAAKGGHADCVRLLLPKSDAFRFDSNNRTALMHAIHADSPECVALLVEEGNPRARGDINKSQEAIHVAARLGKHVCLEALLAVVPHDAKDAEGASAMHVAARWGHAECVRVLLARGAPAYGWEPAAHKGKSKRSGDNPMHWAASGASDDEKGMEIIGLLSEAWDLESIGSRGLTVAQLARASGKSKMAACVEALVAAKKQKAQIAEHLGGLEADGRTRQARSL